MDNQSLVNRYSNLILIILTLLLSPVIAKAIVGMDYNLLFAIITLLIVIMVFRSNLLSISLILLIIPFTEWAVERNFLPDQVMWTPELLSGLLFVKAIVYSWNRDRKIDLVGIKIIGLFLMVVAFSSFVNRNSLISTLLFIRLLLRYYLLFLAVLNLGLSNKDIRSILYLLAAIFVIQIPLAFIKLAFLGQGEIPLGLNGHSIPAILPLIAISYLFSLYFIQKKSIWYIVLSLGFVAFSIIGEKRAFVFLLPILILFLLFVARKLLQVKFEYITLSGVMLALVIYFALRLIPTLNPQRQVWGDFDPGYAFEYAQTYSTATSPEGLPIGRTGATLATIQRLGKSNLEHTILGFGPGSILKSLFSSENRRGAVQNDFGIEYGVTGFIWLTLQSGLLGFVLFLSLFYLLLKKSLIVFRRSENRTVSAFGLGTAGFSFIMIFISLIYSPVFTNDAISSFYFCLTGIIMLLVYGRIESFNEK